MPIKFWLFALAFTFCGTLAR